jgi:two-component system chemotaxis sensor kinase CheA
MSIDMSQFYQVFFEETAEHLANMENLLLTLDIQAPDAEQLNAIFRAAHSIKGSSGTFGFTDLQDVTHILENLLDDIRKGEIVLREDMIDAFLAAGDVLKNLLAAHQGDGEADRAAAADLCARLRQLTGEGAAAKAATGQVAADTAKADAVTAVSAGATVEQQTGFDLYFALDGDAVVAEDILNNLLAELSGLGETSIVSRAAAAGQPWHLRIQGADDAESLRGMLEFIARSDSIRIVPLGEAPETAMSDSPDGAYGFFGDEAPAAPATDESYGFFEPLLSDAAANTSPDAGNLSEAYGFFEPLVAPATEPVAPVAVPEKPATSEPAPTPGMETKRPASPAAVAKPAADTSIRVGVDKVDQLINLVGELVITQAMLAQSAAQIDPVEFERLHNGLIQLERNTRDLQESVMSIRMMQMSVVFSRFPRVVRDISQKLGKQVELKLSGESTELDKGLIERITDPLTHLVRNSLDHGIESPEARAAKGKQPVGTITLSAYHQSGNIVIEVGDDGAGLNRDKILTKARERGLNVHDQMSDQEVFALIFEAGFSTAEQITEVSGRGVGMDVVKKNISALGGRVDIDSMPGIGTRMTVRLPLTLAILDGMSVAVGHETYIIPLGYVIESLQAERSMIKSVSGVEKLIQVREEYLPIVSLREIFNIRDAVAAFDEGIMIILEADGTKAALFVDAMVGQHQVVIKSLESNYRKVSGVSGATIMGDGRVALILDVSMLVGMARHALPAAA